jgi:hypothetical protein
MRIFCSAAARYAGAHQLARIVGAEQGCDGGAIARMPSWSCMKRRAGAAAAGVHRIFTGRRRATRP